VVEEGVRGTAIVADGSEGHVAVAASSGETVGDHVKGFFFCQVTPAGFSARQHLDTEQALTGRAGHIHGPAPTPMPPDRAGPAECPARPVSACWFLRAAAPRYRTGAHRTGGSYPRSSANRRHRGRRRLSRPPHGRNPPLRSTPGEFRRRS